MTGQPAGNGATAPHDAVGNAVTIGEVFTSELILGLLLRWHVNRPGHIVTGRGANQTAGPRLWDAMVRAQDPAQNGGINVNWGLAVANWTDDHERALIAGVNAEGSTVSTGMANGFANIQEFTLRGRSLSRDRGSLQFDGP